MQAKAISRIAMIQRLYRRVLKLHRNLPLELRALGDEYAKDEFRRNKSANQIQAHAFVTEWTDYCKTLETQFSEEHMRIGKDLPVKELDSLSQDQLGQLFELQETVFNPDENTKKKDS